MVSHREGAALSHCQLLQTLVRYQRKNRTHPNLESIKRYYGNVCCGSVVEFGMKLDDWWLRCLEFTEDLDIAVIIEELLDKLSDGPGIELMALTTVMGSNHDLSLVGRRVGSKSGVTLEIKLI